MHRPLWLIRQLLLGGLVLAVAVGCASTAPPLSSPKTLQPADMASLAGQWQGNITGALGSSGTFGRGFNTLQLTVDRDGAFRSNINGVPGQGTIRIVDGKIVYEGSGSRGSATLHEREGRQVIRGDGTLVGAHGWSTFEVTRQ